MKRIVYGIVSAVFALGVVSCTSAPEQRQGDVLMERAGGLEGHAGSLKVRVLYPANVGPAGAAGKRDAG